MRNNLIKIRLDTYVIRFYSNIIVKTELVWGLSKTKEAFTWKQKIHKCIFP
jgi:hypothetical protein